VRSASFGAVLALSLAVLTACGGGGGGGGGGSSPPPAPSNPPPSTTIPPSSASAQQCAPTNANARDSAGNLLAGYRAGTLDTEKQFIRSYYNEAYLWYSEVPNVDATAANFSNTSSAAATYQSLDNYFRALKSPTRTASGKQQDEFSFTFPTAEWNALSSGNPGGYGIEWAVIQGAPPRSIRIAFVEPGSPAAAAGLARGDTLVSVNGNDVINGNNVTVINQALFPQLNQTYNFVFRPTGGTGSTDKTATLTAASIQQSPVLTSSIITRGTQRIGYLQYTTFLAQNGEGQLVTAFQNFATQGITDLVLDLRYNGGGYVYISSQLGYMIAGNARTNGRIFEKSQFNDKRTADNARAATPFFNTTSGFTGSGTTADSPLPTVNLGRVYVITKRDTCSASELIINALRGIDVEVILIGSTTCGKPYGFTAKDNCGVSYFPIEFKGINAKGFGDYADGFIPGGTGPTGVPGCAAVDDFNKPLGDPTEGMLSVALTRATTGACPAASVALGKQMKPGAGLDDGFIVRHPVRASAFHK
jgi:C-terminal processing protease CtpA/Prc